MSRDLAVEIRRNPSADYTQLPGPSRRPGPLDLLVSLRRSNGGLYVHAFRPAERSPRTRAHHAQLDIGEAELLRRAGRLRGIWRDRLVGYAQVDEHGLPVGYPFAQAANLAATPGLAENRMGELVEEGRFVLQKLLAGPGRDLGGFREFLLGALTEEGPLRISFDSELHLPWPLLAVDSGAAQPWEDFLGHRHQVEQTGDAYPRVQAPYPVRDRPVTSLNTDATLESVGRAPEVRKLLEERTQLTVRTESERFLEALSRAVLDEDLMYFWCHGQFVENGTAYAQLAVRLSDGRDIDADLVRRYREPHQDAPEALFQPFVLLNACHTGQSAAAELEHLGRALVELGATGVLGPQIEIPQVFAAEYAFAFLDLYLTGELTAGEIARGLARHFADVYRNPLALTYSLHCGIDSMLELTS
ncbi:CHAT domain-containing protein [Kitasatospora sp. NPDC002551]|uniref:CHAT domain-containing protein n=1 Tax=unclassified Kitasatospora TaxID=2633591 RepID=UPI00331C9462